MISFFFLFLLLRLERSAHLVCVRVFECACVKCACVKCAFHLLRCPISAVAARGALISVTAASPPGLE